MKITAPKPKITDSRRWLRAKIPKSKSIRTNPLNNRLIYLPYLSDISNQQIADDGSGDNSDDEEYDD
jgi:hypothetical protein